MSFDNMEIMLWPAIIMVIIGIVREIFRSRNEELLELEKINLYVVAPGLIIVMILTVLGVLYNIPTGLMLIILVAIVIFEITLGLLQLKKDFNFLQGVIIAVTILIAMAFLLMLSADILKDIFQ